MKVAVNERASNRIVVGFLHDHAGLAQLDYVASHCAIAANYPLRRSVKEEMADNQCRVARCLCVDED